MKKMYLLFSVLLAACLVGGCSMDADMPVAASPGGGGGGGPIGSLSVGFDMGYFLQNCANDSLFPDIPDTAGVYVVCRSFYGGDGSLSQSSRRICTWSELDTTDVEEWAEVGQDIYVTLYVDGRRILEGITIQGELLTHYLIYNNELWAKFVLEVNGGVWQDDDTSALMYTVVVSYDGVSEELPDSLQFLNVPATQQDVAYIQSSQNQNMWATMYWDCQDHRWEMWYRYLATDVVDEYYLVVQVPTLDPARRVWGVNGNATELWHLSQPGTDPRWLIMTWGVENCCEVIQLDDNRLEFTGT